MHIIQLPTVFHINLLVGFRYDEVASIGAKFGAILVHRLRRMAFQDGSEGRRMIERA